jgi:pyruvate dehydrogenase E2 component (dihydrolipoamide acetyltransferase)
MIKYVELTSPDASAFRQAKILSIMCKVGDVIKEGDTLFRVQSGAHKLNLPATKSGRVSEIIVSVNENITLSTALLLLETEVTGSTASKQIEHDDDFQLSSSITGEISSTEPTEKDKQLATPIEAVKTADRKTVINSEQTVQDRKIIPDNARVEALKNNEAASPMNKKVAKKKHQQQSLDLIGSDLFESTDSSSDREAHTNEVVLTQKAHPAEIQEDNHTQPSLVMPTNSSIEITVPDIGADSAKVIEIFVNVGDLVAIDDPIITLESDKASMDVPSPNNGIVKSISVNIDQDISEGSLILELEQPDSSNESLDANSQSDSESSDSAETVATDSTAAPLTPPPEPSIRESSSDVLEVRIPDIGGDSANVIEILVRVGDKINIEDALMTLESDKASMDVPSSVAGTIHTIEVNIDDEVSEGSLVVTVLSDATTHAIDLPTEATNTSTKAEPVVKTAPANVEAVAHSSPPRNPPQLETDTSSADNPIQGKSHASPSIRRFARELGVDLTRLAGSGRKGRITHDDVKSFVKGVISQPPQAAKAATNDESGIPQIPAQDFSKFGEIDVQPLNKIKRLTATNLHRSWLNVPHVTHNDESNISDLESFRKQLNSEYAQQKRDIKLSPLAFIVKAVVNGLQLYPQFNSSLEPGGESLIYKKYFNIGIAVETPNGLVVPVLKDADKKSVAEIAKEMGELAKKARDKKLTMNDMSGSCFTISSLGGIGGTGFTPIVNAPEVAILGVSRSKIQPVWNGSEFIPGMILPLSLSYDHRVIDGAEAARFTRHVAAVLEDVRRLTV